MAGTPNEQGDARRLAILEKVWTSRRDRGYSPTIAELVTHTGISRSAVVWHLRALIASGLMTADDSALSRSMQLTRKGVALVKEVRAAPSVARGS